jgi:DNA helicase IV
VSLLSAVSVKGLEFDDVILVEPSEILEDGTGDLFVAMTRSTRRLHVVAAGTLPSAMDTDDPQIRALAR